MRIYCNNLKKKNSKIHLYEKIIFEQKDLQFFFKVMSLASFISFAPKCKNQFN